MGLLKVIKDVFRGVHNLLVELQLETIEIRRSIIAARVVKANLKSIRLKERDDRLERISNEVRERFWG